jgi:polar amino acid transport system substrate-binding protein
MGLNPLRRCVVAIALSIAFLASCANVETAPNASAVRTLAPKGKLRVGLYPGTPTSIIGDPASNNAMGVGFELGRALAQRAGVPFEPVVFAKNTDVLAAAKSGSVDMVFTNATPTRMNDMDFSPAVLQIEQGYLVPAGSAIRTPDEIDRTGARVGVSEGSTSEATLSRELRNATVVRTSSLMAATEMLSAGKLDAFATNKATLFEMSNTLPGSRVLDGRWGLENFAIGIPKDREAAMPLVRAFVRDTRKNGVVTRAVERAGLRGTVSPD